MSRDKSLKSSSALTRHRNVLTRFERIERLRESDRFEDGNDPFGLAKVAHRKVAVGAKTKKKTEQTEETAAAEEAAKSDSDKATSSRPSGSK